MSGKWSKECDKQVENKHLINQTRGKNRIRGKVIMFPLLQTIEKKGANRIARGKIQSTLIEVGIITFSSKKMQMKECEEINPNTPLVTFFAICQKSSQKNSSKRKSNRKVMKAKLVIMRWKKTNRVMK